MVLEVNKESNNASYQRGAFSLFPVPNGLRDVLESCEGWTVARSIDELVALSTCDAVDG